MTISSLLAAEPFGSPPLSAALLELGFPDAERAARLLASLAPKGANGSGSENWDALLRVVDDLAENLARAADPDRALVNLSRLCDAVAGRAGDRATFFHRLHQNHAGRIRLARLVGWSQALADSVIGEPGLIETVMSGGTAVARGELRRQAEQAVWPGASPSEKFDALRRFRRAQTLRIGLLDLGAATWRDAAEFGLITRQISDLAQVCVSVALDILTGGDPTGFAVIMMGKGGARELNYSSDIDLIFLQENRPDATTVGQKLLQELGAVTAHGQLFRVDTRLRPDGSSGTLVTPFGYALSYYESYAGAWEWQALIKARAVAGDATLARRFRKFTRAITWAKRPDDAHLRDVFEMKRRNEATPEGSNPLNVKQGPGGVRDAEWVVQQLQLMIGPSHPRARSAPTLRALANLEALASLSPLEARQLREGYLWLRTVEHRLQLLNEQPVRELPKTEADRAALARRMGCPWTGGAAALWLDEEYHNHRRPIRALCERIFWAFAPDAASEPEWALPTHLVDSATSARLHRMAHGTSTRPTPAPLARQIRTALAGALTGLERAADPTAALANLEQLCEASGNRLSLLRALAASPRLAWAVFTILGGSQTLSDTLIKFPELLDIAARPEELRHGKNWEQARSECRAYCLTFRDRKAALRRWKARELLRIGMRDLLLDVSPHAIAQEISQLAGAFLDMAWSEVRTSLRPASEAVQFAIFGLGKFGGLEMHYASDCDLFFGYAATQPSPVRAALAARWSEELLSFCGERTEDGPGFTLDLRLRPGGASGPLAATPDAFRDYVENPRHAFAPWERQALTRARFAAGDGNVAARIMALARTAAFPATWKAEWSDDLHHIKGRMETERAARSTAMLDLKQGPGGLADIEWTAQWLAMKHGHRHPGLQTPNTRRQLSAAREAGLLSERAWGALARAHTWLRRAELRLQIAHETSTTNVDQDSPAFRVWARAVFPGVTESEAAEQFLTQWHEHTAAARKVFEGVRDGL